MTARADGLRQLCHDLYQPLTVHEVCCHIGDIADAATYIQQCSRQLTEQLQRHRDMATVGVDSLTSSFTDPAASATASLTDAFAIAADLAAHLQRAAQAASHLYDTTEVT